MPVHFRQVYQKNRDKKDRKNKGFSYKLWEDIIKGWINKIKMSSPPWTIMIGTRIAVMMLGLYNGKGKITTIRK